MADKYIWTGTDWESLQGPQGPEGPSAVSADAGNASKIGTDGLIYTPVGFTQAQADTRYVELTGDTMTGPLVVGAPSSSADAPIIRAAADGASATIMVDGSCVSTSQRPTLVLRNQRGTIAAPQPLLNGDVVGAVSYRALDTAGTWRNCIGLNARVNSSATAEGYDSSINVQASCSKAGKFASFGVYNFANSNSYFLVTSDVLNITSTGFIDSRGGTRVDKNNGGTGAAVLMSGVDASVYSSAFYARTSGTHKTAVGVWATADNVTAAEGVIGLQVTGIPKASFNYSILSAADADSYIKGNLGINWSTPTVPLEVGGDARVRGALDVVGNITSTGTAHSFAAGSIPGSAVAGIVAGTPASGAAPGSIGTVRHDDNFLYICVAANVWKRVALTSF